MSYQTWAIPLHEALQAIISLRVPRWAAIRIRAPKKDLDYLGAFFKGLKTVSNVRLARTSSPGLELTWAHNKLRLLYRCEAHTDCQKSFELGRACHLDPASIAAWKADQERDQVSLMGVMITRLGRPVAVEVNVLWSIADRVETGYVLSGPGVLK